MVNIKISDRVLITVKRNELVGKVLKIEGDMVSCSFFMPRSKGMSIMKVPLSEIRVIENDNSDTHDQPTASKLTTKK